MSATNIIPRPTTSFARRLGVAKVFLLCLATQVVSCAMPVDLESLEVPSLACNWQQVDTHATWSGHCVLLEALDDESAVSAHDDCQEPRRCAVIGPEQIGYSYVDLSSARITPKIRVRAATCEAVLANVPHDDCDFSDTLTL
jgi:hypothetical protein